jgi:DNA-binding NarL/FixJ family response regulator
MKTIKIAILDNHILIGKCTEAVVNSNPNMRVVFLSHSGKELIEFINKTKRLPDIVLLEIETPDINGLEVLKIIKHKHPKIKVIILTIQTEPYYIIKMIENGSDGYLFKDVAPVDLHNSILKVLKSGQYFNDSIEKLLQERKEQNQKKIRIELEFQFLTDKQIKILELICYEKTTIEIAKTMNLSVKTIEKHRAMLMTVARAKNIVGLVLFAISKGIFKI